MATGKSDCNGMLPAIIRLIVFTLFAAILSTAPVLAAAGNQQPKQNMPIRVALNIHWKIKGGGTLARGAMDLSCDGSARLNKEWSMMDKSAPPGSFITYSADGVRCNFSYREKIYEDDPPKGCGPLLAEYHGAGPVKLEKINTAMTSGLNIRKLGNLIPKELLYLAPPEAKDLMIDYYDFFAISEKKKIYGRRRNDDCLFKQDDKEIYPANIVIRFRIADDGSMTGRRRWKVKKNCCNSPDLEILVSDLPQKMERRPLVPEPDPQGNITYAVNWTFGKVKPVARIERHEGEYWIPLPDDKPVEVTAGEKMELRGIVLPEKKDPKHGRWSISGDGDSGRRKMYIKKFDASARKGEVQYLAGEDLEKPQIRFYWTDEGTGKVTYRTTADGKKIEETVKFRVKKPKFILRVEAAEENKYGKMNMGKTIPTNGRCCVSEDTKKSNDWIEKCKKMKKKLEDLQNTWHNNCGVSSKKDPKTCNAMWDEIKKLYAEIDTDCHPRGIQYSIKFIAEQQDNIPGEVQFVQLVSEQGGKSAPGKALDGCYPFFKYPPRYTKDMPGFTKPEDVDYRKRCFDFEMYLMFKPDGQDNEWIPLKKAPWSWCGAIRCEKRPRWCHEDKQAAKIPPSGEAPDCKTYPEWRRCSSP